MKRWLPLVAAALLLTGAACSSGAEGSSSGDTSADVPFEISEEPVATTEVSLPKSYRFEPVAISIDAGDEVTWTNEDDFPHNVHLFDGDVTEDLPIGESATIAFDEPGDYYYECSLHPDQMQGMVVVN